MKTSLTIIIIGVLSALLFTHSLGNAHLFDWDEINFAESAREMIASGNFERVQINFHPFWEKPPLFIWMQVISMKLFGINEFAARFPNAIAGILTLTSLFLIGTELRNSKFGIWWAICYGCSFLPHMYFKSGIIDPWFNLFIFFSFYFFIKNATLKSNSYYIELSGLFLGLAVLTKGPVAILIVGCAIISLAIVHVRQFNLSLKSIALLATVTSLFTVAWFGWEVYKNGFQFIDEFITYQIRLATTKDAGHGGFIGYHIVVLLIGCFPASLFLFSSKKYLWESNDLAMTRKGMTVLLAVVIILFSIVKTKIVHYSSLAYFPISFLAAYSILVILSEKYISKLIRILILVLGIIWSLLLIILPLIGENKSLLKWMTKNDLFATQNMNAEVDWPIWLTLPGILLIIGVILFYILSKNKLKLSLAIQILFITSLLIIQSITTFFIPRIEQYTQRAAIDFYKTKSKENVPIETLYFKSYAQYFYGNSKPENAILNKDSLIRTSPTGFYFVSKVTDKKKVIENYSAYLEIDSEKNGFVFYKRRYFNK